MTHSASFNAGNGFDNARGIATKKTKAPHSTPATRMAEREIRSAAIAARSARMSGPVLLRMTIAQPPRLAPTSGPVLPDSATRMVFQQDYFGVNPLSRRGRVVVSQRHGRSRICAPGQV